MNILACTINRHADCERIQFVQDRDELVDLGLGYLAANLVLLIGLARQRLPPKLNTGLQL